jgi:uncharacterized membrane protein YcgQ (UPF0703/DUF1980 family)
MCYINLTILTLYLIGQPHIAAQTRVTSHDARTEKVFTEYHLFKMVSFSITRAIHVPQTTARHLFHPDTLLRTPLEYLQ